MDGPLSSATHHMTLSIACESFTNGMHVLPYTNAVYYAPMWNKCKWSTGICREKFRGQHCTSMLSSCSSYVVSVDLIFSNCKLVRFFFTKQSLNGALGFSNQEMVACSLVWMLDLFKIIWLFQQMQMEHWDLQRNFLRPTQFCLVVLVMEVYLIFSNNSKNQPNSACKHWSTGYT